MEGISFTADEKAALVMKLQDYFVTELGRELEQFDAEFLLDFFGKELGRFYYNRGLLDAQAILEKRLDDIKEAIVECEVTGS